MAADRTSADQALIALWEQLRTSPRLKGGFLLAVVALIVTPLAAVPTPERSSIEDVARWAFDHQVRLIREAHPRPLAEDVVLIGIDEETYSAFDEPFALWHRHFGSMLRALARAKPRAIAMDTVLPERSYDFIQKGSDLSLMQGLALLKNAQVPFVYVQTHLGQGDTRAGPAATSSTTSRRTISGWTSKRSTWISLPGASSSRRSTRPASPCRHLRARSCAS